uniref:Uncharacterized protein n=1 Tax=Rhizophora mucronata TaxID=61149 RepID=A0A2P2KUU5_RHIMU
MKQSEISDLQFSWL